MSTSILGNEDRAALYCTTTLTAFGPVFGPSDRHMLDATETVAVFLAYLKVDPRNLPESSLDTVKSEFEAWIERQDAELDVDDLCRVANGERKCRCGEWFSPVRDEELCEDCEYDAVKADAGDHAFELAGGR